MANVTYGDICKGKTLQLKDTLIIHGVPYKVIDSEGAYYLQETNHEGNSKVFEVLHVDTQETIKWAEKFGYTGTGIFPEIPTLEKLTAFVKEIYERSPYKVGDIVRVKKLEESDYPDNYPFSFTRSMSKDYGGKLMKIFEIDKSTLFEDRRYHNGDPHQYSLCNIGTGENSYWNWHSSMFEKAETQEDDEEQKEESMGSDYDIDKPIPTPDQYTQEEKIVVNEPQKSIKTTIIL